MKKFWGYISAFLAGIIAGLIAMYKIMGDQITIEVRKIKNKGVSGTSNVNIPISLTDANLSPKQARRNKRIDRKNKRKARKALKLIE